MTAAAGPLSISRPLARSARIAFDVLRRIGWKQWILTALLSIGWGLANLFSHVTYTPPEITEWDAGWLIYMTQMLLTGLMLLFAMRVVEAVLARPGIAHYLLAGAIALSLAVTLDVVLIDVLEVAPIGFSGDTPLEQATHRLITITGLLFLEGEFIVLVYARLRIARRTQEALARSELQRADASRQVLAARLSAMQAQVEPSFLFSALAQVEALYEHNAAEGERMLNELIAYLRAALPRLRGDSSTLGEEAELVRSYLSIVQTRMGGRLSIDVEVPLELRNSRFPPMVLLPLADNALRHGLEPCALGGRISVHASRHADRLHVVVSDDGVGSPYTMTEGQGLAALRERLRGLYADRATLVLEPNRPQGVRARVEVPCETSSEPS